MRKAPGDSKVQPVLRTASAGRTGRWQWACLGTRAAGVWNRTEPRPEHRTKYPQTLPISINTEFSREVWSTGHELEVFRP